MASWLMNIHEAVPKYGSEIWLSSRMSSHGAVGCQVNQSLMELTYFSFQPVLHDWYNKGHGICYPANQRVAHIKATLGFLSGCLCGPLPYI